MAAGRVTRSLREHQSAYEDQARDIQEKISTCRQAYQEAKDALEDLLPSASDSVQRKAQLPDRLYANIMQLQAHAYRYETEVSKWAELLQDYNIEREDSEWAESMRVQYEDFFELAPRLEEQLEELLATYRSHHDRAEHLARVGPRNPAASARTNDSTDTATSPDDRGEPNAASNQAHNAGDNALLREPDAGGSHPAHNAGGKDLREPPPRPVPDATPAVSTEPRRVRTRTNPLEEELRDLFLRSEGELDTDSEFVDAPEHTAPPASARRTPPRPLTDRYRTSRRRSPSPYGLFATGDGLYTRATPMAWHNAPSCDGRGYEMFYSTARPSGPNYARTNDYGRSRTPPSFASRRAPPDCHAAHNAVGDWEDDTRSYRAPPSLPPMREQPADAALHAEHRQRPWHDLRGAPPAGGGRSEAPDFGPRAPAPRGPSPVAATRPPPRPADHGVDFARENASKFYQNAVYTRDPSNSTQPLVLNQSALQKFGGDIRSFPAFRNGFLETVEGRNMAPRKKLQYLLQCLTDEPLRDTSRYMLTDANYYKVIDRLEAKYGNRTNLLMVLGQCFFDLKPPGSATSDIRRFHGEVTCLVDEMAQIGEDADQTTAWRQQLVGKLPVSLRQKIFEKMQGNPMEAPISELLSRLDDHLLTLEATDFASSWNSAPVATGNSNRGGPQCRPDPRSTANRAGTYFTKADVTDAARERNRRCTYCGRDHWALGCGIYVTLTQRIRRLQQLQLCFLCLRGGHRSAMCPKRTNEPCPYCHNTQHHQSICREAIPHLHPPFASSRQPVRAPTPGTTGVLKNESTGDSSSQQHAREPTPVNRAGVTGMPTATPSCPSSAQISSTTVESNLKKNRHRRSKGKRTSPNGRNGTTRPTTACVDENVTQMAANACGGDGLLPVHPSHLTMERRSTLAEAQWYDRETGDGTGERTGFADAYRKRGPLDDEEVSLPDSTGHCSDAAPNLRRKSSTPTTRRGYAVSTSSPADNNAVLLECQRTTAVNTNNGRTRSVIVFFDSGSNRSFISMQLALDLRLPCLERRYISVNTFGTDATTAISGFDTTVLLRSAQGASVPLVVTASNRIVPPVTTAIVDPEEVTMLQKNQCSLISSRETPDLLIGQDLWDLFDRRDGPKLPNGFRIYWSTLGPLVGGAGMVASQAKTASMAHAAAALDPKQPSNTSAVPHSPPDARPAASDLGYNPEDPLNLWTLDPDLDPAHNAGPGSEVPTVSSAHNAGSWRVKQYDLNKTMIMCVLTENDDTALFRGSKLYGTTASTTLSSAQPQAQWIRQRSQRKTPNPLDTNTEPLPPTCANTLAVAAVADAAHNAAKQPKLPSEPYYAIRFAAACLRSLHRNSACRKNRRRHGPSLGYDPSQCLTTLGRKPAFRDLHLVTTIILRKTQLRRPPSNIDRGTLGMVKSEEHLDMAGRPCSTPLAPAAPKADPPPVPLADQSTPTEDAARTDHRTVPTPASILQRTADAKLTEPGIVEVAAHNAVSETLKITSATLAAAHSAVALVPAQPPISASTAEQTSRVQDVEAATDARASSKLSATSDAATLQSSNDAPAIAASAASRQFLPPPPTSKHGPLRSPKDSRN